MILYFSGTGNSKYVAKQIAKRNSDEIVSLNRLLKQGAKDILESEEKPFVFVVPTYGWRIPEVVDGFIRENTFKGSNKVYFILTCGTETANAIHHVKKLSQAKKWELLGFAEVILPGRYIAYTTGTDNATAEKMFQQSESLIRQIASDISEEKPFTILEPGGFAGKLKSGIINVGYNRMFVSAKGFHYTEKCNRCQKCVRLCPLNNIEVKDGGPVWGNHCSHCMACIHGCPQKAIEFKNNTQDKPRYYIADNETL